MKVVTARSVESVGSAWEQADFRRLFRASAISVFGSEIGELALPLLAIITLSATPEELGLLRTLQFLPFLVATLPLGALVDGRPKRSLMMKADVGRFILIGAIPATVWLGIAELELVYVVVFAAGCLTVLYQLADFAYLPVLVREELIVDANSKLSAVHSANEIAGKGIGGVIVQALTAPFAVLFDAATYLVSALDLWRIRTPEQPPRVNQPGSIFRGALSGLVAAWRHRYIRPLLLEATTFNFFNEIFLLSLLLHAVRDLELHAAAIGLVFVGGGVGSFVGAWFGPRLTERFGYGRVLVTTMAIGNGAPLAAALARTDSPNSLAILVATFGVMGLGIGIANVHAVSLRQMSVGEHVRGRINAGYRLVSWGALAVGATVGGLLAASLGAYQAMMIGAIGIPLATAWVALSPIPQLETVIEAGRDT